MLFSIAISAFFGISAAVALVVIAMMSSRGLRAARVIRHELALIDRQYAPRPAAVRRMSVNPRRADVVPSLRLACVPA